MPSCSSCNAHVLPEARICEYCGAALIDVTMAADEVALVADLDKLDPEKLGMAYVPTSLEGQQAAFEQALGKTRPGMASAFSKKRRRANGQLLDRAELIVDAMEVNIDEQAAAAAKRARGDLASKRSAQKRASFIALSMTLAVLGGGSLFTIVVLMNLKAGMEALPGQMAEQQAMVDQMTSEMNGKMAQDSNPKEFEDKKSACAGDSKVCSDTKCRMEACAAACKDFADSASCDMGKQIEVDACQGKHNGCEEACQLSACAAVCETKDARGCAQRDVLTCLGHKEGCDDVCQLQACSVACKTGATEACAQRKKILGE